MARRAAAQARGTAQGQARGICNRQCVELRLWREAGEGCCNPIVAVSFARQTQTAPPWRDAALPWSPATGKPSGSGSGRPVRKYSRIFMGACVCARAGGGDAATVPPGAHGQLPTRRRASLQPSTSCNSVSSMPWTPRWRCDFAPILPGLLPVPSQEIVTAADPLFFPPAGAGQHPGAAGRG